MLCEVLILKSMQWKRIFIVAIIMLCGIAVYGQTKTGSAANKRIDNQDITSIRTNSVAGQVYSDSLSVTVYFPCGSSNIAKEPANLNALGRFIQQLDSVAEIYVIKPISLLLTSSASPEGGLNINRKISRRRGQSVIDYLKSHSNSFSEISTSTACRTEELTTNHLRSKTSRAEYPSMRYAKVTLHITGEAKDAVVVAVEPDSCITPSDSIPAKSETIEMIVTDDMTISELPDSTISRPILFVKTNLLYDLLTAVNASVEVPLTDRLTIEGTYVNPWWRNVTHHKTLQIRYGAITPRYYFKNSAEPYTSFFAGLTAGMGKYDLQWTRRGVQGTMWTIAPTIGYSHYIGKRWKMEYSASVGYLQTKYCKYTQVEDTKYGTIKVKDYPWVSHVMKTVFPVSLNVSIVYTFNRTKRIKHYER